MNSSDFQQNPLCKLFNIDFPIIQGGMVWCAGWELAAAVSEAGGLGLIGAGSMDAATLKLHIQRCQNATSKPFGVNIPLLYHHASELIQIVIETGVKIVFSSAGNPKTWTKHLQSHGIIVVHVVSNLRFAVKAAEAGVDAIVAEGFEAGGHNGREELTTLTLLPLLRNSISIPLIAAGGIATGNAMLACMILGADGVQLGSRFVASEESSAHISFKMKVLEATEDATMLAMKALTPVRLLRNSFYEEVRKMEESGASSEDLKELLGRGRSKRGMFEGDLEQGELEIGQVASLISEILPASQIVANILAEYQASRTELLDSKSRF